MDEQFAYRTGRTDPAKSSRGIIAALMVLVILSISIPGNVTLQSEVSRCSRKDDG